MKRNLLNISATAIIAVMFLTASSCSKESPASREDEEIDPTIQYAVLSCEANSDTLFLKWKMQSKSLDYDGFQISDSKHGAVTFDAQTTEYALPDVPVQEDFKVTLSIMKGTKALWSTSITEKITGIDDKIQKELFHYDCGVTAGDGVYSILLPDGRSIFLMGDSYTGIARYDMATKKYVRNYDHMFRNTYNVYDHGQVSAITTGSEHSAAVPAGYETTETKWYWPGHGFVKDNILYIFQSLMYQGAEGAWGFRYECTHVLEYSLPDIKLIRDYRIPYSGPTTAVYGAAAMNDGDWLYVYAQSEKEDDDSWNPTSEVYAARTTAENIDKQWEYYTGSGWSTNSDDAKVLEGLSTVPVSSQFNVFKLRNKYVLLTRSKQMFDGRIYTFTSDTPYGPWGNRKQIYTIPDLGNSNWYTYNAMAHPQFEKDGRLLVSFCVNTSDFNEQFTDVECYRPRFFWYPVDSILN